MKTRVMYIQRGRKARRIGRVRLSKTGRTLYYRWRDLRHEPTSVGRTSFRSLGVHGKRTAR